MKLSYAIREGAKIRPQCYNKLFNNGCSCTLGAALEYIGYEYSEELNTEEIVEIFNAEFNLEYNIIDPISKDKYPPIGVCTFLNDDKHWTREDIANYLEDQGL